MGHAQPVLEDYVTPEDYLAAELQAETRHEYCDGVVCAMSGTTSGHWRIVGNLYAAFHEQLRGRRCEAFSSEIKVRYPNAESRFFYYPDLVVDCGKPEDHALFADDPRVIFEVLSPSTRHRDRNQKWENYQTLLTLDVYVLVEQAKVAIKVFRRSGDGWTQELLTNLEDVLELPTVECALTLRAIYERTALAG